MTIKRYDADDVSLMREYVDADDHDAEVARLSALVPRWELNRDVDPQKVTILKTEWRADGVMALVVDVVPPLPGTETP